MNKEINKSRNKQTANHMTASIRTRGKANTTEALEIGEVGGGGESTYEGEVWGWRPKEYKSRIDCIWNSLHGYCSVCDCC